MASFGAVINLDSGVLAGPARAEREDLALRLQAFVDPRLIRWTDGAGVAREARQLAQEEKIDVLLVGGGDGTVSTAGGVAAKNSLKLAILPLGTLNHLARDLGIPLDPAEALEVAARARHRPIDVGEINGRTFLNNVSLGIYPALVAQRRKYMSRHGWRRAPALIAAGWQVLRRSSTPSVVLELDDRHVRMRPLILFVGNNAYGGTLWSDPKRPRLDSGKLWVCMTRAGGTWVLMKASLRFAAGTLEDLPEIDTALVESLTIHPRTGYVRVAIDGETCRMRRPLKLRSLPGALEVIIP